MSKEVAQELAPTGTLRAGINLSNFLLVTGRSENGDPQGVSPSMAAEIANRLGLGVEYVSYKTPGEIADAALDNVWDIGNIGAEPQRAQHIEFTAAYVEIKATYLVPPGSPIQTIAEVDQPGKRIAVSARSAYDLWLERNIQHAELVRAQGLEASYELFVNEKLDALAGLEPKLLDEVERLEGSRILAGQFTAVQQAIGTQRTKPKAAAWLKAFVEEAKASGLVQSFIDRHKVRGLSVAPLA